MGPLYFVLNNIHRNHYSLQHRYSIPTIIIKFIYLTYIKKIEKGFERKGEQIVDIIIIAIFIIDILLTFRTSYFNNDGEEIVNT